MNGIHQKLAVIAAALSLAPLAALAATATDNLSVTATVGDNCTISTAPVAFGAYDPIVTNASTPLDGTGTVTITCTQGATTSIELGLGSNANVSQRRMKDAGTNYLNYELYQETARTTIWGTTTAKKDTGIAPSSAARAFTVYGRVTAGQDVPLGSYSDTVLATVNF